MKKNRISRTSALRSNLKTNAKHVFGRRARVGDIYTDCHVKSGHIDRAVYVAMHYEPEMGLFIIKEFESERHYVLGGDIVVWNGELYADKVYASYTLAEPILETLENYKAKNNLECLRNEDIQTAMRERYPKFGFAETLLYY